MGLTIVWMNKFIQYYDSSLIFATGSLLQRKTEERAKVIPEQREQRYKPDSPDYDTSENSTDKVI